jgi:7-cyano-7-deazaguanine synthase
MCCITGLYRPRDLFGRHLDPLPYAFTDGLANLLHASEARGRDGFGYAGCGADASEPGAVYVRRFVGRERPYYRTIAEEARYYTAFIANHRAEPVAEYVDQKTPQDQQPMRVEDWLVVHNGMIANDKEIERRSGVGFPGSKVDTWAIPALLFSRQVRSGYQLPEAMAELAGSKAVAVLYRGEVWLYRDYQPLHLWWFPEWETYVFSSLPDAASHFRAAGAKISFPPYSTIASLNGDGQISLVPDPKLNDRRAVVVCSGGLDSTTAAKIACMECDEVTLLHFKYGCRAQDREVRAVREIAAALGCKHEILELPFLRQLGGSPLTDASQEISQPGKGIEYAHEWVPARNTLLAAMAASYCDRYDIGRVYLGLNLEEAGVYADNSMDFYWHLNELLACGTRARPRIHVPVANLMKREIVALGMKIGAPLQHSWSCYRGGERHCGRCPSCHLRRSAFRMNGMEDVVAYEE